MTKQCTKCKIIKNINMFYKDSNKKLGRQSNCKACQDIATLRWRNTKGKTRYKAYKKSIKAYEKHKMRNKKRSKEYRETFNEKYIRELICKKSKHLKPSDIPNDIVKAWIINLKLKRSLKKES